MTDQDAVDDETPVAFGRALAAALEAAGLSQAALGERVGVAQNTVSTWVAGKYQPEPKVVFSIERALDATPGSLSLLLGYLPPEAAGRSVASVREAIASDPRLDTRGKAALLAAYDAYIAGGRRRRG